MIDRLLTVAEAAELLQVSKSTVYRYAENSALPHIRKKFGLRFWRKALEAWLDQDKRNCLPTDSIAFDLAQLSRPAILGRGNSFTMAKSGKAKSRYNFAGYGAVYQRAMKAGSIRWYLDYKNVEGERIQKVAPLAQTKEDAILALQEEIRKEFNREYRVKKQRDSKKFSELASLYIDNYAKQNKKSWRCDDYIIQAHMLPYFGDLALAEITPLLIEKYRVARLKTGIKKSSENRELSLLRRMYHLGQDWDLVDQNPVTKVKFFSEKDNYKERILQDHEEALLLAACPDYLRPIIIAALNTGMRRGEILNLQWSQVDLNKRTIRVENTKSGKNRIIPVNEILYQELSKIRSSSQINDFIFLNPQTGKPFVDVKRSFKTTCKELGIKNLRFHDLRHTFATRLIQSGVDIICVKELLGHQSVIITQRYTHTNQDLKKKAVEQLIKKTPENIEKKEDLLHMCDTAEAIKKVGLVTTTYSIN